MFKRSFIILITGILLIFLSACGTETESSVSVSSAQTASNASSTADRNSSDGLKPDGKIHVYIAGDGEKITVSDSTFINYLIYYPDSDHLIINMNGKDYVYANVGSSMWTSFKKADSKETYYNDNIKGDHSYWINDYDGSNGDKIVMDFVD